ncbi:MAG: HxsD-like protein [Sandaracinaceae bacterium]|nr:MAG: hypothetical protein EVA89_39565 [Sandaracinaceae bacterium]
MSERADQRATLSADLYSIAALRASAEAFSSLAAVSVEQGDKEHTITITDAREDVLDRVLDELLNHALEGTILGLRESEAR